MKRRYVPQWTGPVEGFSVNYMRRHFWRLRYSMEWEDVMQECSYLFLKMERKYEHEVTSPAWFMALYKTALRNLVNDLAVDDTFLRQCTLDSQLGSEETQWLEQRISLEENEGVLHCMIDNAPDEVRSVLFLMLNAPPAVYKLASQAWGRAGRKKEHGNAFLCSMLGFDVKINVAAMTRDYFAGGTYT